jgi:hypothetical protein
MLQENICFYISFERISSPSILTTLTLLTKLPLTHPSVSKFGFSFQNFALLWQNGSAKWELELNLNNAKIISFDDSVNTDLF